MPKIRCRTFTCFFLADGKLSAMRKNHARRVRSIRLNPQTVSSIDRVQRLIAAAEPLLTVKRDGFDASYLMPRNWSAEDEPAFTNIYGSAE